MAQYDGSIRINTEIEYQNAKKELKTLESNIEKTADKIASLRSKMDALKDVKTPTQEYKDIQNDISKAETELGKLLEKQAQMQNEGKDSGAAWDRLNQRIQASRDYIELAREEMQQLVDAGRAFTLGSDTQEYQQMSQQMQQLNQQMQSDTERQAELQAQIAEREEHLAQIKENAVVGNQRIIQTLERIKQLEQEIEDLKAAGVTEGYSDYDIRMQELVALKQEVKDYNESIGRVKESYKKLGYIAKKALDSVGNMLKKASATINSFGKRIKEAFSKFTKSASEATKSANGFALSLKNILKYGFGIRSLYALINKIRSAIKEGFTNLYNDRDMEFFRNSIDNLKSSALTLKNALAAAFSPFVEIALPYVQKLLDYMTQLLNIAGQFFAAITGRKTYIKAIKQTTDALKEETKEMNRQLSPLDKLNNLSSQKGAGTDTGGAGTMFEEVPIASSILDMAEKVKDILSKLFEPLKEAWEREGKFVMDSWKYALDEVWKLIKDIGRDFLTVWQQEATVKIFEDLLHIIGDIGLIVGHLARNFREAWNESQTGLHILENIRDIIGVIIHNIRLAADQTVKWADKLNFKPLLESFERFTKSLIPLADTLSGVLTDFYTHVLLPLAKWTIEKGLPELLDVFTAFNEKVDWQALRDNLAEFWDHLEPFAETIGEGLIIFIERVSDALADFLNSQEFKDFLVMIENWMDSVSPEEVADALEMITKGLIALKLAVLGFGAISAVTGILTTVKTFLSFFGIGGAGATAAKGIGDTTTALGGLAGAISDVGIATAGALAVTEPFKDKMFELAEAEGAQAQTVVDAKEKYDGWIGSLRLVKDEVGGLILGMQGLPTTIASSVGAVDALDKAMEAIAKGTVYTDEQMQKMQNTWGFTAEDMEMLRQEMLDTNPALRNLADEFPTLRDASAESLSQINKGFEYMQNGVTDADDIVFRLNHSFGELTPTAQEFFDRMGSSSGSLGDLNYEMKTGEQVIDGYVASLENTSGAIEQFSNDIAEASANIGEGMTAGMENVNTDSPAKGFFSKLVASIQSVFGIHSPASTMYPFGENILLGVVEGFKSKFNEFTNLISQLFTQISAKFTNGMSAVRNIWTNAWNSLPNIVKNIINSIMSMVSSFVSSISNAFSKIGGGTFTKGTSRVPAGGSSLLPRTSTFSTYAVNPALAALQDAEIPRLATGAVIPANREFLAVLGDQKHGTNVEAPLEMIEQANKKAILQVLSELGMTGGNNNNSGNNVYEFSVDGQVFFRIMQKYADEYFKQNGKYAFT